MDLSNPSNSSTPVNSDPRHVARLLAVQYLFSISKIKEYGLAQPFEVDSLLQIIEEKKYNKGLYSKLVDGVENNYESIDLLITTKAPEWPIDQINPINLAVLRVAVFEAFIANLNPIKVVINEAIDIAKELSGESDGSFVNGVLGNIYKDFNKDKNGD